MTRARETFSGKKHAQVTVRLSEKDELRLLRLADGSGIPAAVLCRIWVLKGMAESSRDDVLEDNLSSSDFSPLSEA